MQDEKGRWNEMTGEKMSDDRRMPLWHAPAHELQAKLHRATPLGSNRRLD